jgi:hypothetical protein
MNQRLFPEDPKDWQRNIERKFQRRSGRPMKKNSKYYFIICPQFFMNNNDDLQI